MANFEEQTQNMSSNEILNTYRNLYCEEPDGSEKRIVANAINDVLPKYVKFQMLADAKMLYRKVYVVKNNCSMPRNCTGDCDVCPSNFMCVEEIIIPYNDYDEKIHFVTQEIAMREAEKENNG